jgi:hypothetical protein
VRVESASAFLSGSGGPSIGLAALAAIVAGLVVRSPVSGAGAVPVMIGGDPHLDACGGIGVVSRVQSTVTVRTGPGLNFGAVDRLGPGTRVWLCDRKGRWLGVVYGPELKDCGVSTPTAARRSYSGTCASGWIFEKYIALLAG